jgi:hypothetical protein
MITTKTVLVLGAGASAPYEFPTGDALIRGIRDLAGSLDTESWCIGFLEYMNHHVPKEALSRCDLATRMKALSTELRQARPFSIDEFLGRRPDLADAGRLVISICLLQAEHKSEAKLQSDGTPGHWYDYLKSKLVGSAETLGHDQLRLITFNYERSLEHFLYQSLGPYYSRALTEDAYTAAIKQFRFLHIYGSLGPLPWQSATGAVPYGAQGYQEILTATKSVKVLHQGAEDAVQQNFKTAQEWLQWADRVLFLGFGFHKDNVERLKLREIHKGAKEISGTCKALDRTSKDSVQSCVTFPNSHADCYTFLHDHVVLS